MVDHPRAELSSSEINPKQFRNVRVEHGQHVGVRGMEQVDAGFRRGDTRSHDWGVALRERISTLQPAILSIDSLSPLVTNGDQDITPKEKEVAWLSLPDRVSIINSTGQIHLVNGDMLGVASSFIYPYIYQAEGRLAVARELNNRLIYNSTDKVDLHEDEKRILAMGSLVGGVVGVLNAARSNKDTTMSRRRFLHHAYSGVMGVGVGAIVSAIIPEARIFFINQIAQSRNAEAHDLYLFALQQIRPIFVRSEMAHARTALGLEKLFGAMQDLNMPEDTKAAAIFGSEHGFESGIMLESQTSRHKAIEGFARKLLGIVDVVIAEKAPQVDRNLVHRSILNYLETTDILSVKDPGGSDINPQLPQRINEVIKLKERVQSRGVHEALKSLYPKAA